MRKLLLFCAGLLPFWTHGQTLPEIEYITERVDHAVVLRQADTIWVASAGAGLQQYDLAGTLLARHLQGPPSGLPLQYVYDLCLDPQGRLVVAGGSGVVRRNGAGWEPVYTAEPVYAVRYDAAGTLWVGGSRLRRKQAGAQNWEDFQLFTPTLPERILKIESYGDGTVYVGAIFGWAAYDPVADTFAVNRTAEQVGFELYTYPVYDICRDTAGQLWFIFKNDVYVLASDTLRRVRDLFLPELPPTRYLAVDMAPDGRLYFGSNAGFTIYDGTPGLENHLNRDGFRGVLGFYFDGPLLRFGHGNGYGTFDGTAFTQRYSPPYTLTNRWTRNIYIEPGGKKWFLGQYTATAFDGALWTAYNRNDSFDPLSRTRDVAASPAGATLAMTWDTVFRVLPTGPESTVMSEPFSGMYAAFIEWNAATGEFLLKKDNSPTFWRLNGNTWESFTLPYGNGPGCSNTPPACPTASVATFFHVAPDGQFFWADGYGLYRTEEQPAGNSTIECLDFSNACPSPDAECRCNRVNAVVQLAPDRYGIATRAGVFEYQPATGLHHLYDRSNAPLPSDTVLSLAVDPENRIYIGTAAGLVVLQPDSTWQSVSFDSPLEDGLSINGLTVDTDGSVWASTMLGAAHILAWNSVGISTPPTTAPLRIWPNPLDNGSLTVALPAGVRPADVAVHDALGRTMLLRTLQAEADGQLRIQLSALPAGVYGLTVRYGKQVYFGKFVRSHTGQD